MSNVTDRRTNSMVLDKVENYRFVACGSTQSHCIQWRNDAADNWLNFKEFNCFTDAASAWLNVSGKKLDRPV